MKKYFTSPILKKKSDQRTFFDFRSYTAFLLLLTGSGCMYYESDLKSDFGVYDLSLPGQRPIEMNLDFEYPEETKGIPGILWISAETHSESLRVWFHQEDDRISSVTLNTLAVEQKNKLIEVVEIEPEPLLLKYYKSACGGNTSEGYSAFMEVPLRITPEKKTKFFLSGSYLLKNGTTEPIEIEADVQFSRNRKLMHYIQLLAEI